MLGEILSAVLWFALGVIATLCVGLYGVSYFNKDQAGKLFDDDEESNDTIKKTVDVAHKVFGDNSNNSL